MNCFNRLSTRSRFLVAPFIGVVLTLLIFFSSNSIIQKHTDIFKQLHETNLTQVGEIIRTTVLLSKNNEKLEHLLIATETQPDEETSFLNGRDILNDLELLEEQLNKSLGSTHKIINGVDIFEKIRVNFSYYREKSLLAIQLSSFNPNLAKQEYLKANMVLQQLDKWFLILSDFYVKDLTEQSGVVESTLYDQSSLTIFTILLLAVMVFSALFFSRRMSSEIDLVNKSLIGLSKGKKTINLPKQSNDNMHQLYNAVYMFKRSIEQNEKTQEKLSQTIGELTDSKERYINLLNLIPTAIIAINDSQKIVLFNKAAEKILGYDSREIFGKRLEILMPEQYRQFNTQYVEKFKESELDNTLITAIRRTPVTAQKKNGDKIYIEASIAKLQLENENMMTIAVTDVTDRMQAEKEILHKAHYDALTDLPNRFLALDCLNKGLKEARIKNDILAVLFLDLDGFKKINDTLGHETGDKLLIEAGKRLQDVVREGDTVGRLGGDEFIVILYGLMHSVEAVPTVQKLIKQFRKPFEVDDRELILTASVGISSYPEDGDNASELLRKADAAMYSSKDRGRNTSTFFTESMNLAVSRQLTLEEQLHGALKRQEFRLVYQPQIDISSGQIVGAEVLIRWNNNILGEVLPEEFIPIAEHTGLIIPLSQFVLSESLKMLALWQVTHESTFRLAVNLSPRQFRDPNFISFIKKTLRDSGVAANTLELEITEGVLMSGHSFIDDALSSLSKLGIRLAMDDFGTGYSSLSYLRKYSFDTLKIDRSFINDINLSSRNRELVNAIIAMAQALGLEIVAEGVETKTQLKYLAKRNCEYAQGYFFNKPITSEEVTVILERQKRREKRKIIGKEGIKKDQYSELVN
ncbi:EAL domain-containing protein [uncultured Cocleimonas sp.]|uniref:sensor domain-containing protein n=1 Tax=uncultured Cocleimonas sp. TaxID=1051587 RepID=UPI0026048CD5|nr:EAL domain-containing protein [uncultured Cocleimonas sp.]